MENRKSYNPHNQRLDRPTLVKISELYSHIFNMTKYVYFYDDKAYLGTKNEPMNNGTPPYDIEKADIMEHLISDWDANNMYILTNIECPVILSIGKLVSQLTDGKKLNSILDEIRRCLNTI